MKDTSHLTYAGHMMVGLETIRDALALSVEDIDARIAREQWLVNAVKMTLDGRGGLLEAWTGS